MPEQTSGTVVISNTSPVFYLHQIGHLEVLKDIYGAVLIPPGVEKELEAGAVKGLDIPSVPQTAWLEVRPPSGRAQLPVVPDLGQGERRHPRPPRRARGHPRLRPGAACHGADRGG